MNNRPRANNKTTSQTPPWPAVITNHSPISEPSKHGTRVPQNQQKAAVCRHVSLYGDGPYMSQTCPIHPDFLHLLKSRDESCHSFLLNHLILTYSHFLGPFFFFNPHVQAFSKEVWLLTPKLYTLETCVRFARASRKYGNESIDPGPSQPSLPPPPLGTRSTGSRVSQAIPSVPGCFWWIPP